MTTPVGERDALLQVTSPRFSATAAPTNGLTALNVLIFQRNNSSTTPPTAPSADAVITFSTGVVTGLNNGWTQALPDISAGSVLWVTIAYVAASTSTYTIHPSGWQAAQAQAQNGTNGSSGTGTTGPRGAGHYFASGNPFTDALADAACPGGKVVNDEVTISNGTSYSLTKRWNGTSWLVPGTYFSGDIFIDGSINNSKVNTNGMTIRAPDGTVILDASGSGGLNIAYAPSGTLNSNLVPSIDNAATKGVAINSDPYVLDASAWVFQPTISITNGAGGAAVCDKYFTASAAGDAQAITAKSFPINPSRVYNLSANLYAGVGNTRNMYILIDLYDASGAQITGATTGWGGAFSGYVFGDVPPAGVWSRQGADIGVSGRAIPANARTCKVGVWFQYTGAGSGNVQQGAQDIRLVDVTDARVAATTSTWAGVTGTGKPVDNATFGATFGVNMYGQITATTASTYIANGAIQNAQIGTAAIGIANINTATITNLAALSAELGSAVISTTGFLRSGQTDYNTGTGWWIGLVGGVAKMSMGVAGGAGFTWDGSAFTINNATVAGGTINNSAISSPTITSPILPTLSVSGMANVSTTGANGIQRSITRTASPSGGRAPYTFIWVETTAGGMIKLSNTTSATVTITANGNSETQTGVAGVTVTDSNGAVITSSLNVSCTFA